MSLFDILEGRMQQIFEGGNAMAPLPFKKLAKQAVREMKRSTVKVDGRVIAPSLYTVLVNPVDDGAIAPLYQQVTDELVDFVAHEIQNNGFDLMSAPMVRFIADPNIKQGKMEIVAEVVTPDVLDALRVEEAAYAQTHASHGMRQRGGARPMGGRPPMAAAATPRIQRAPQNQAPAEAPRPLRAAAPAATPAAIPVEKPAAPAAVQAAPAPNRQPQERRTSARNGSTCELTDTASGRTWRIGVPTTILGRDEALADLVLNDTNVSRKHAELTHDERGWHIADLGSTNGTRVNGLRTAEANLHNGDTISMGLITLSFREM